MLDLFVDQMPRPFKSLVSEIVGRPQAVPRPEIYRLPVTVLLPGSVDAVVVVQHRCR